MFKKEKSKYGGFYNKGNKSIDGKIEDSYVSDVFIFIFFIKF